jgi:hypothetical protein
LFWIALILAIPTAGLSLLLYVCLWAFNIFINTKSRENDYKINRASNDMLDGHSEMPSWYKDENKLELFVKGVTFNALRKGANKQNIDAALVITGDTHVVLKYAGALEKQGSSFIEQQVACADFLVKFLKKVEKDPSILNE